MSICWVSGKEEDGNVRGVDDSAGEAFPLSAKFSFIAIARCVDEYDRADSGAWCWSQRNMPVSVKHPSMPI